MESIYDPVYFNATEHIDLKKYFKEFSNELYEIQKESVAFTDETINEAVLTVIDLELTDQQKVELEDACSVDHLTVAGESEPIDGSYQSMCYLASHYKPAKITKDVLKLKSVRNVVKTMDKIKYPQIILNNRDKFNDEEIIPSDLSPGVDVVLYAQVFRCMKYRMSTHNVFNLKFDYEIMMLGRNTLADYKDIIGCASDIAVSHEMSENLDGPLVSAKEQYPSSFIFLDGTFYNDERDERAIDYSQVIRDWATDRGVGHFRTARMDAVRWDELTPRFGYPYLYQHQAGCEHLFILSYARLLTGEDPMAAGAYPRYSHVAASKLTLCALCNASAACWLVCGSDRMPRDKALLCADCFKSYHYVDGQKIGRFQAYPYFSRTAAM